MLVSVLLLRHGELPDPHRRRCAGGERDTMVTWEGGKPIQVVSVLVSMRMLVLVLVVGVVVVLWVWVWALALVLVVEARWFMATGERGNLIVGVGVGQGSGCLGSTFFSLFLLNFGGS